MSVIKVDSRTGTTFGSGFTSFLKILLHFNTINKGESVELDMSECGFLNPFILMPLTILIIEERKNRVVTIKKKPGNFSGYLDLVSFGSGLQPENIEGGNYQKILNNYSDKTYIPIVNFPADRTTYSSQIRENFLTVVSRVVVSQLQLNGALYTALMYLIDEAINNIVDHSKESRGYIFAQYYPSRKYIDICIADAGIGILQTYLNSNTLGIVTDVDALKNASLGKSTKDRPGAEGRGYGITSSKAMISKGLDGKYLILSGNGLLINTSEKEEIIMSPPDFKWNGTIVGLRIPYAGVTNFSPTDFYEV